MKFERGQLLKHVRTGGFYIVITEPQLNRRLEHCNKPYYEYMSTTDGVTWARRQDEMEDGRFIKEPQ